MRGDIEKAFFVVWCFFFTLLFFYSVQQGNSSWVLLSDTFLWSAEIGFFMMKSSCFYVFWGCIGIKSNVKLALSDIFCTFVSSY